LKLGHWDDLSGTALALHEPGPGCAPQNGKILLMTKILVIKNWSIAQRFDKAQYKET
jgi:hypothetical protein